MDYKQLSMNIARLRKAKGFTQDQLAEQLGVSAQAVSKWENGQSYPDISLLPKLAEIFEVSMDELFSVQPKNTTILVPEAERKDPNKLMLRIRIDDEGNKVRVNLPLMLVKAMVQSGSDFNIGNNNIAKDIDFDMIFSMIDKGVMGELVEIESDDGTRVSIFVE